MQKVGGSNPNSYSLTYFESTGTGTDDTGTSFYGTGTGTDGTDSTSTDAFDIGTILSHFHWWILRLSAIQKNYDSLTHWLNNIGLRDASASKNPPQFSLSHGFTSGCWEEANAMPFGLDLILQQKYDFFRWKYKMSLIKKYWWKARAAAASWISSVAGRQSPGEEVGRVARFQRHTKLVVAQFWIFRGTAGAFPSTYWGSFEFFWCNGNGDLLLRSGAD